MSDSQLDAALAEIFALVRANDQLEMDNRLLREEATKKQYQWKAMVLSGCVSANTYKRVYPV